jgi:hypothetical protein
MCCLVTTLLLLGPRLVILVWWFMDSARISLAFATWPRPLDPAFPHWVWPLVGAIFVPWTTLAYLIVFPGDVVGQDWPWLGLGLLINLGAYFGGGYRKRNRLSRWSR